MKPDHPVAFSRHFAMPSAATCSIPPVRSFVDRWLAGSAVSVDPFARDQKLATLTNDMDLATAADHHHDAEQFLTNLHRQGVMCDRAIFDPPYSPRQVSEHYRSAGREVGRAGTQTSALYRRVRLALDRIMCPGGIVLSFGWHSNGMGPSYQLEEIVLVAHGSAHNDTICIAERKLADVAAEMARVSHG
jgi:hypothetical protein